MSYDRTREDIDKLVEEASSDYTPFSFVDPNQVLQTFSPAINSGEISLHPWQEEVNTLLSGNHGDINFSKDSPLKFHLVAANGSGKDSMVIAGYAVWQAMTQVRSRCIVTSKSVSQIRGQTEPNIRMLCEQINKKFEPTGQKIFLLRKGHYFCFNTGAEILAYVTDEEQRAEGFHPWPDAPGSKLSIIINEAKSVEDEIARAFARCTYTQRIVTGKPSALCSSSVT